MANSRSGETMIERTLRVLEAFDPEARMLTVSEVAERAALPLSTASRIVEELEAQAILVRDDRRRVRLGVRLWELASRASPALGLREVAMPFMEDLHATIGHHTQLGVLDGDEVLFIERLSAPGAVINVTRIAGRLPAHLSSSGLVLLAHGSPTLQERILAGSLAGMTAGSPTDPRELRAFLADVRRRGFAYCPGFIHTDAAGVAAPVRDRRGRVIAALGVVVPNDEHATACAPAVIAAAHGIRRSLGMASPPGGTAGARRDTR